MIYYLKTTCKKLTSQKQLQKHYKLIHLKNLLYNIPPAIENTYNYLLYSWKRKNAYNALLYDKFMEDYSKEAFQNLCFIAVYNSKEQEITASWALVKLLQEELAISRKKQQMQAVKLSLDDERYLDTLNLLDEVDMIKQIERDASINELYNFISNNLTTSQLQALQKYLYNGKKIDTRQKKLILHKLKTEDLKQLIYDILY